MSIVLVGFHVSPDIWVLQHGHGTGFQMLTARAKQWAQAYKEIDDPRILEHMLWVPQHIGSGILQDIATETNLNVLVDEIQENQYNA